MVQFSFKTAGLMIISKERVILFLLPRKSIHCEKQANSVSDFIA